MKILKSLPAIFASCGLAAAQQSPTPSVSASPIVTASPAATPRPTPPIPDNVEVIQDVVTGTGGARTLHAEIARPKNPPPGLMPAVIFIHGGGWSGGSYKNNPAIFLAAKGYFTASAEYRLSGEAPWPAQIEDCKLAVRWLRANAATYHVDPDRIGCWGVSAGGHLVACLGTMGNQPEFEGTGGYPGVSSKVQAVADFCGPTDLVGGNAVTSHPQVVDKLIGASYAEKPEAWRQASPINYVRWDDPPFLIVHGDKDPLVPIDQASRLAAALQAAGVPVEYLAIKGGGHGYVYSGFRADVLSFFDRTLRGAKAGAPATP